MSAAVERIALAEGYDVARLINGCWQLSAGHDRRPRDRRAAVDALLQRADAGFTTFDCADIYGGVEELLGEVLAANRRRGGPPLQVHTKCVPDRSVLPHLDRAYVRRVVDRSLVRLGIERLDLVQFHWWDYAVPGLVEAAGWLEELRREGKIRLLGATNFDLPHLRQLVDAGIPIRTHQVQYSLLDRRPAGAMADYCRARGIHLLAYGTLAGGFLGPRYHRAPPPAEPLANRSLVKYRLIIDEVGGWRRLQQLLDLLLEVARRHRTSPATVATRWVLDRPAVAAAIVGSPDARHLDDHRRVFAVALEPEDRRRLDALLAEMGSPAGEVYALEREPGGRHASIMKTELNRA